VPLPNATFSYSRILNRTCAGLQDVSVTKWLPSAMNVLDYRAPTNYNPPTTGSPLNVFEYFHVSSCTNMEVDFCGRQQPSAYTTFVP
jgi:hypothetical protein